MSKVKYNKRRLLEGRAPWDLFLLATFIEEVLSMRNIADVIEQFIISELFANDEDSINVKEASLRKSFPARPVRLLIP